MYKRAYGQRRPPLIPPNYSGNAFRQEDISSDASELDANGVSHVEEDVTPSPAELDVSKKETRGASPFAEMLRGGLGNEELLILALIFLTSQSGADDLLPLLIILLFSK